MTTPQTNYDYLDSYSLGKDELTGKTLLYVNGEFYLTDKQFITYRNNYDGHLYESDDGIEWVKCEKV